jgi:hypothetical protein
MSVVNPFGVDVWVNRLEIARTTKSTGAGTGDFGVATASATTLSDTLLDGLNLNATEATETNNANGGTNGKVRQLWPTGKWITGSTASGNVAGLVGTYAIYWSFVNQKRVIGVAQAAITGDGNVSVKLSIRPV